MDAAARIVIRTDEYLPNECTLCGPSRFRRVLSLQPVGWENTFGLWRCHCCDLEFIWPQPTSLSNIYDEAYYRNGYFVHQADRRRQFRELLKQFRQREDSGPLLDVGAGIGLLVSVAKQENWQAEGIEPSAEACRLAREICGIHLTCRKITEMPPSSEFGVVVLWQVLAHVPDPLEMLRHAAKMLRPDGTLLVSCIHWDDPHYRLARLLTRWKKVNAIHIPTILWRFREEHLKELVRRAGLRVHTFDYGRRAFQERFGWKRRLVEQSFEAYRKMTHTGEEIRVWCSGGRVDTSLFLKNSTGLEPRALLRQAPLPRRAETAQ